MSNEVNEGFVDRLKDIARGLGGGAKQQQQQTPTTTQTISPIQNQPSNQSATTTASKQAKGTSAAKGGGRVQPKSGMIDVRRATYGKMMLALQAAGITDENQQKQYSEQIITNIIIPFLTVHLNARGLNVTDLRSKKTSLSKNPTKDQSGNPRVVTLSEQTDEKVKEAENFLKFNQEIEEVSVGNRTFSFKDFFQQYLNSILIFKNPELLNRDAFELRNFLDFFTKQELKFTIDKVRGTNFLDDKNKKQLLKLINNFNNIKSQLEEKDIKQHLLDKESINNLIEKAKTQINKIKEAKEIIANAKGKTTKESPETEQEEDVEDPPTNPGQETESLKNYRSQLEKLDSKVFPKELGKNPVLILSKLFASNPELAKEFGFKQKIKEAIDSERGNKEAIDSEIRKNYRGDQLNNQPAKLLKALAKQGININLIQAKNLAQSIISLNPQQVKSVKQVSRTPIKSQQQDEDLLDLGLDAPTNTNQVQSNTEAKELEDIKKFMDSKKQEIDKAQYIADMYDIVYQIPIERLKVQYLNVLKNVNYKPSIFTNNENDEQKRVTSGGGFREKLFNVAMLLHNKRYNQTTQPQTQQPTTLIPSTPEAQSIAKTKIDINQPIPLFTGNASLLQRINSSIKSRAKNINVNDPNIQNQFKQIIKDLVDQLKINGITNKQIQENFDFTEELLNEQITSRWKLLANIK